MTKRKTSLILQYSRVSHIDGVLYSRRLSVNVGELLISLLATVIDLRECLKKTTNSLYFFFFLVSV